MASSSWRRGALSAVLVAAVLLPAAPAASAPTRAPRAILSGTPTPTTTGTQFWFAVPPNGLFSIAPTTVSVLLTAETPASGTVSIPGISYAAPFTVTPGTVTAVDLPAAASLPSVTGVVPLGGLIEADAPVAASVTSWKSASGAAYRVLPTVALGTDYRAVSFEQWSPTIGPSSLAVIATVDGTTVTVTPQAQFGPLPPGEPGTRVLDAGDVWVIASTAVGQDVTGTGITSSAPVAVLSGSDCAEVPAGTFFCDMIAEQVPPITAWGTDHVVVRSALRSTSDVFRIVASQDGTAVVTPGATLFLNAGGFATVQLPAGAASAGNQGYAFHASRPVLVAQYAKGNLADNVQADPFMTVVPPVQQYLPTQTVTVPNLSGFRSYLSVTAPEGTTVTLDGTPIPASDFNPAAGGPYVGAQVPVTAGQHTLAGSAPIGVVAYGYGAPPAGYALPGGMSLAPVASVASVVFDPASLAGVSPCPRVRVTAAPVPGGAPLEGVQVRFDLAAGGPASPVAYAWTDADGWASACLPGSVGDVWPVTAVAGTVSTSALVSWLGAPVVIEDPASVSVPEGMTVRFTAAAVAAPAASVRWQGQVPGSSVWHDIPGAVTSELVLAKVQLADSGRHFRAVFSNVLGSTPTRSALLLVKPAAPGPLPSPSGSPSPTTSPTASPSPSQSGAASVRVVSPASGSAISSNGYFGVSAVTTGVPAGSTAYLTLDGMAKATATVSGSGGVRFDKIPAEKGAYAVRIGPAPSSVVSLPFSLTIRPFGITAHQPLPVPSGAPPRTQFTVATGNWSPGTVVWLTRDGTATAKVRVAAAGQPVTVQVPSLAGVYQVRVQSRQGWVYGDHAGVVTLP